MGQVATGLGVMGTTPSRGSAKVDMKARLPNSFARKEIKIKKVRPWLHQIEAYMETQGLKLDNK